MQALNLTREAAYPTTYANSSLLPLLLLSLTSQKQAPITKDTFAPEYDYIVVGAGVAGSVMGRRLSEIPWAKVLVLEAGGPPPVLTDIPTIFNQFSGTDIDWKYTTIPQKNINGKSVPWISGKAIGGSSVLNAMFATRGNRKDYDRWASEGAKGWSYQDVLPYFKKLENFVDMGDFVQDYHGIDGPMTISKPAQNPRFQELIFNLAQKEGYRVGDINGPIQKGFYDVRATIRKGQRCSAAKAYLAPVDQRKNLDIVSGAFVTKIIMDKHKAKGVELEFKGSKFLVKARKEVILSAGAVRSPQLLMLSGIGPKEELEKHNISVITDLPVGKTLQDHISSSGGLYLSHTLKPSDIDLNNEDNIQQYINFKTGLLASIVGYSTLAFLDRKDKPNSEDYPEIEYFFSLLKNVKGYGDSERVLINCALVVLHPKSTGTIKLKSADPHDIPLIDPNYYDDEYDRETIIQGIKKCQNFKIKDATPIDMKPLYPECQKFADDKDKLAFCMAQSTVFSLAHVVSTAKMGDPHDPSTVVDPELRVKGIKGLRVVDSSVFPSIIGAHTYIPTVMVAEKASDMIKKINNI